MFLLFLFLLMANQAQGQWGRQVAWFNSGGIAVEMHSGASAATSRCAASFWNCELFGKVARRNGPRPGHARYRRFGGALQNVRHFTWFDDAKPPAPRRSPVQTLLPPRAGAVACSTPPSCRCLDPSSSRCFWLSPFCLFLCFVCCRWSSV